MFINLYTITRSQIYLLIDDLLRSLGPLNKILWPHQIIKWMNLHACKHVKMGWDGRLGRKAACKWQIGVGKNGGDGVFAGVGRTGLGV